MRHRPVVASTMEVSGAGSAPQGAASIEVANADPRLGDSTKSLLQDLVVRSTSAGVPRSAAPGDKAPAPRSSSTMGPGISGLYLPGSPRSPLLTHQLEVGRG
jgi:hypothetical protein